MFCEKCGAPNADNASFCSNCGNALHGTPAASAESYVAPLQQKKAFNVQALTSNPMIKIIAAAVAVLLIVMLVFGGRGYKATTNKFINAIFDANASTVLKIIPDDYVSYMMDEADMTRREFRDELEDTLGYVTEMMDEFYPGWKVSHKIIGTEKISGEDLQDIKEEYRDYGVKVSKAMLVHVDMTLKYDGESDTDTATLCLIKVGRSWYIDMENSDSIF